MPGHLDIDSLLAALTLEQKASLCSGVDFWHTQPIDDPAIPAITLTDGPHGVRKQVGNADQPGLLESEPATCFPAAATTASSWDEALLHRMGEALAAECRAQGVAVLLGPGVNMKRSPLCGRNFEYFSEDPVLAGALGTVLVQGIQSGGVGTSLKHFAANNQETDRLRVSVDVDDRTLREIYLPAFERVVTEAQPWTVMCSYNKINGTYASQHPWLLTEVLRNEWGFTGLVVSDWGAVRDRPAALAAGLDLEMPTSGGVGDAKIVEAVRAGRLTEAQVDAAARRVLELVDRAESAQPGAPEPFDVDAHHALAREIAAASIVLLRNEDAILPLSPDSAATIAVIGEFATKPRFQGAGSSQINPTRLDCALDEIRATAHRATITYARGFDAVTGETDPDTYAEAIETARHASVAIVFVGLPARIESEGYDRSDLLMPVCRDLIEDIANTGTRVIAVVSNGAVVSLEGWHDKTAAILETWLGGQAGGGAVADVLFGAVNPSGKLAETIPLRLEDNPSFVNFPGEEGHVRYGEGVFIGYRWYDKCEMPVRYPFGYGMSYTTFEYSDPVIEAFPSAAKVSFTVTNTGTRAGAEVAQVYVGDPQAQVARPPLELKGFAKVHLEPGRSERVEVMLDSRAFSYWSTALGSWKLEGGEFEIAIGASSRDLRLRAIVTMPDDGARIPLGRDSTLGEFLDHPVAGPLIRQKAQASPMLSDEQMLMMASSMPMDRVLNFSRGMMTDQELADLIATANR